MTVNTITDFSILKVISFGKLEPSYGYNESDEESGTRVCEHSDIIKVCLVGFTLGMLLLSGRVYLLLKWLWTKATGIIGGLL